MRFSKLIIAALASIGAALITISPAAADEAAEVFVQSILDEAEPYLNAPTDQERLDGIASLVDKYVDMRRVSLFVLGQYARKLTDEQRAEYLPLFKDYATVVYQNVLGEYSGQTLAVSGSIDRSERDIIVNSKIVNPAPGSGFENVTVHWRIYRDRDGNMSAVDAGADNLWLALEQRSSFTSVISNNGGPPAGVDALIAQLKEQTQR